MLLYLNQTFDLYEVRIDEYGDEKPICVTKNIKCRYGLKNSKMDMHNKGDWNVYDAELHTTGDIRVTESNYIGIEDKLYKVKSVQKTADLKGVPVLTYITLIESNIL